MNQPHQAPQPPSINSERFTMSKNVTTIDALIRAKARKNYLKELTELFKPVQAVVNHLIVSTKLENTKGECTRSVPDGTGGVMTERTLSTRQMLETVFALTYNDQVGNHEQAAVDKFLSEFERLQAQVGSF
jgi:hypothetical protein